MYTTEPVSNFLRKITRNTKSHTHDSVNQSIKQPREIGASIPGDFIQKKNKENQTLTIGTENVCGQIGTGSFVYFIVKRRRRWHEKIKNNRKKRILNKIRKNQLWQNVWILEYVNMINEQTAQSGCLTVVCPFCPLAIQLTSSFLDIGLVSKEIDCIFARKIWFVLSKRKPNWKKNIQNQQFHSRSSQPASVQSRLVATPFNKHVILLQIIVRFCRKIWIYLQKLVFFMYCSTFTAE